MSADDIEPPAVAPHPEGAVLTLRVVPRSSRNALARDGEALRLKLTAPPVDGAANAELQKYLSKLFAIAKSDVEIIAGQRGRRKRILLRGVSAETAREVIAREA